jgi:hypothetical protein
MTAQQYLFPFAAIELTRQQEEAIENLADGFMGSLSCPPGAVITAADLTGFREGFKGLLRLYGLPIPDDAYLDELLLEMAEWHDQPIAECLR